MRKHWSVFSVLFFLLILPHAAAAAPHVIHAQKPAAGTYISDLILQKKPIRIKIKKESSPSQSAIVSAFAAWFENVLSRLDTQREEQLAPLLEFIRFGAQQENYIFNEDRADISFIFDNQDTRSYCGRGAGGCFYSDNMRIYTKVDEQGSPLSRPLLHEIGHSLRMKDLYDEEFRPDNTMYGSGKHPSVMDTEDELTCDDADAIVNALYVSAKENNFPLPDISFTSFCTPERIFKNARQLNRSPLYIDYNDSRTVYTFCQDGTPHSIARITPSDIKQIYQWVQKPVSCSFIPEGIPHFVAEENVSYQIRDFSSNALLESKEISGSNAFVTYLPLPAGGLTLALRREQGPRAIPAYAYITDENGRLVYLFAHLPNEYNFVYNFFLNGSPVATQGFIFVYNRQDAEQYYSFQKNSEEYACHAKEEKDCIEMKKVLDFYTDLFIQRHQLAKPIWGGFYLKGAQSYIKEAQNWEAFLQQYYPQLVFYEPIYEKELRSALSKLYLTTPKKLTREQLLK